MKSTILVSGSNSNSNMCRYSTCLYCFCWIARSHSSFFFHSVHRLPLLVRKTAVFSRVLILCRLLPRLFVIHSEDSISSKVNGGTITTDNADADDFATLPVPEEEVHLCCYPISCRSRNCSCGRLTIGTTSTSTITIPETKQLPSHRSSQGSGRWTSTLPISVTLQAPASGHYHFPRQQ